MLSIQVWKELILFHLALIPWVIHGCDAIRPWLCLFKISIILWTYCVVSYCGLAIYIKKYLMQMNNYGNETQIFDHAKKCNVQRIL